MSTINFGNVNQVYNSSGNEITEIKYGLQTLWRKPSQLEASVDINLFTNAVNVEAYVRSANTKQFIHVQRNGTHDDSTVSNDSLYMFYVDNNGEYAFETISLSGFNINASNWVMKYDTVHSDLYVFTFGRTGATSRVAVSSYYTNQLGASSGLKPVRCMKYNVYTAAWSAVSLPMFSTQSQYWLVDSSFYHYDTTAEVTAAVSQMNWDFVIDVPNATDQDGDSVILFSSRCITPLTNSESYTRDSDMFATYMHYSYCYSMCEFDIGTDYSSISALVYNDYITDSYNDYNNTSSKAYKLTLNGIHIPNIVFSPDQNPSDIAGVVKSVGDYTIWTSAGWYTFFKNTYIGTDTIQLKRYSSYNLLSSAVTSDTAIIATYPLTSTYYHSAAIDPDSNEIFYAIPYKRYSDNATVYAGCDEYGYAVDTGTQIRYSYGGTTLKFINNGTLSDGTYLFNSSNPTGIRITTSALDFTNLFVVPMVSNANYAYILLLDKSLNKLYCIYRG